MEILFGISVKNFKVFRNFGKDSKQTRQLKIVPVASQQVKTPKFTLAGAEIPRLGNEDGRETLSSH